MIARARALLRRNENTKSLLIKVGELSLDTQLHSLNIGTQKVDLTPKEYSILEYLLRNKNRVISRTKLTQHVYEYNFDTDTNVIDVYINKLRGKIEQHTKAEVIHTVRGIGYVINEN